MTLLDSTGREIKVGDRVRWSEGEYTVVHTPVLRDARALSVGLYHGPLAEYERNFCIPWDAPSDLTRLDNETEDTHGN